MQVRRARRLYQDHWDDQGAALTMATSRCFKARAHPHYCETVEAAPAAASHGDDAVRAAGRLEPLTGRRW